MWVCLNNSFLSIVENFNNRDQLLVRGRVKGDIERVFPSATVLEDMGTDYKYRTFLPRQDVANKMLELTQTINYDNFKSSVDESFRVRAYSKFWDIMYWLQQSLNP